MGGWDGQAYVADGYAYDPDADAWTTLPPLAMPRANAVGGILGGTIYVVGGGNGGSALATCEMLEAGNSNWQSCPPLSTPRAGAGAAVLSDQRLYVLGGAGSSEATLGEIYDAETQRWEGLEIPLETADSSWASLGVAAVESRIFLLGGRRSDAMLDSNIVYAPFIHRTYLPSVGE